MVGDFNARVKEWGSDKTNRKGEMLKQFVAGLGLLIENRGNVPTFQSNNGASVIDFRLSRLVGTERVVKWATRTVIYSYSDHNYIIFETHDGTSKSTTRGDKRTEGWALKKLNTAMLEDFIVQKRSGRSNDWLSNDPETAAERFHLYVWSACTISMPRRGTPGGRRPTYWWNEGIAECRKK